MSDLLEGLLIRQTTSDNGTFGVLVFDDFVCHTLELPWRNNEINVSCIPCGDYICKKRYSPNFKYDCYLLEDVPGRTWIQFHRGNWAGDKSKGKLSDVLGCILVGSKRAVIEEQLAIAESGKTLDELFFYTKHEPFKLTIMSKDDEQFTPSA